jgi:hypothetical protein
VKNNLKLIQLLVLLLLLSACRKSVLDHKEYMKFMADKNNGLVKEASAGGVKVKVKHLPLDYLVYNAVKSNDTMVSEEQVADIKKSYESSITFMLTLGPDDNESFHITRVGISSYEEFAERIETMSFHMKDYITLKIGDKEYKPDLTQMESINSPERSKSIIVVFKSVDEAGKSIVTDDLVFIYNDELFFTGINKFKFLRSDLVDLPELKF